MHQYSSAHCDVTERVFTQSESLAFLFAVCLFSSGMITIPAASLAGGQIIQTGSNTSGTGGQGTVTVAVPVTGNVVNAGGMVMVSRGLRFIKIYNDL